MSQEAQQTAPERLVDEELAHFPGAIAIEGLGLHQQRGTIGEYQVRTNLPENVDIFEPTPDGHFEKHPFSRGLLPSALDTIPAGEYYVSDEYESGPAFDRDIVIRDEPDGRRINYISFGLTNNIGGSARLMTALGYKYRDPSGYNQRLEAVPTPETLESKAAALGVDVKFFPDQGEIPSKDYLKTFAEGCYPVSTASAAYYTHDTADDHLTAMVLGGPPLKEVLRRVAQHALEYGKELGTVAEGVDEFTSNLRGTVALTQNTTSICNPDILRQIGGSIGIAAEEVDVILQTAMANARDYGMEVRDFPTDPAA